MPPLSLQPAALDALSERALAIKRAARLGRVDRALRGRNFGLISEVQASREAELFHRAASELGAKVARILPSIAGLLDPAEVETTARWLGRLYDAVEVQGLPSERVAQIRGCASIPVLESQPTLEQMSAALAAVRDGSTSDEDCRRYVLQAWLISSFG
jgi:ornithine carbamoyltransferase